MYIAEIKNLDGKVIHRSDAINGVDHALRWASVQGKVGFAIERSLGRSFHVLINEHDGSNASLEISLPHFA